MGTHYSLMRETGATDSEIARVRTNLVKAYALLGLEPEEYDYYVSSDVLQSARRMHVTVTAAQTVEAHHGERAGSAVRGGSDLAVAYGLIVHVAVRA